MAKAKVKDKPEYSEHDLRNMRRNELAKMVEEPGSMTKDQLLAEILK